VPPIEVVGFVALVISFPTHFFPTPQLQTHVNLHFFRLLGIALKRGSLFLLLEKKKERPFIDAYFAQYE
jgi:hypothetical protein